MIQLLFILAHLVFVLALGFYIILALQWFSYSIYRVVFHYTKPLWHIYFLIIPLVIYSVVGIFFKFYVSFLSIFLVVFIFLWHSNLDKKLVFTPRVIRFFVFLIFWTVFFDFITFKFVNFFSNFAPILFALVCSFAFEKINFLIYKKEARKKLLSIKDLKIIAITASFGKTSMKNFVYELLKEHYKTYKTPKSVNTIAGIVKDINEQLPTDTQIYIVEAGARNIGDIEEIATFINPEVIVVGEIGEQHIEYFKSVENVRKTKLELFLSNNLKFALVHSSTNKLNNENIIVYDRLVSNVQASLEGLRFDMKIDEKIVKLHSNILGEFNAYNIAVAVLIARYFKINLNDIIKSVSKIKSIKHRLEKMIANGKFIIDDSFNGNLNGMLKSYDLVATYKGKKVIITPGLIESNIKQNTLISQKIAEVFDFVILTSSINKDIFLQNIPKDKIFILSDKSKMVQTISKFTKKGDLILFSNDAPNFI